MLLGAASSSAHQSTFESDTLTHFSFIFFRPLESLLVVLGFLFFLQPFLLKGLEGLVTVGLASGSKREKDS